MIIKPELVKKIKDYFNLNIYETKVWLALLGKGIASAGEVAEISGVPRSRTYDVLESLEKRGFAIMKLGKPVKYIAVKPNIIIEKLKTNTIAEANDKIKNISKLKEKSISIESKFFISDSEQVLFIISNGKLPEEEIAIWLNTPFFTSALSYLFDKANKEPAKEN